VVQGHDLGKKWTELWSMEGRGPGAAALRAVRGRLRGLGRAIARAEPELTREQVHQLRVSARRAEATILAFAWGLDARSAKRARRVVREVRRAAGVLRDTDVHAELFEALRGSGAGRIEGVGEVIAWLDRDRTIARAYLREVLSRTSADKVAKLSRMLEVAGDEAFDERLDGPAPTSAGVGGGTGSEVGEVVVVRSRRGPAALPARADAMFRELAARARSCAAADLTDLVRMHELRVAIKRLRYVGEVLGPVLDQRVSAEAMPRLVEAQGRLGEVNDVATLVERMDRYLAELATTHERERPEGGAELGRLLERLRARFVRVRDLRHQRVVAWWRGAQADGLWESLGIAGEVALGTVKASAEQRQERAMELIPSGEQARAREHGNGAAAGRGVSTHVNGSDNRTPPAAPGAGTAQGSLWVGGKRLAVIDIGSNSIRLLAVELIDEASWRTLAEERAMTRLAHGLSETRELCAEAMARSVEAISRFVTIAGVQKCTTVRAFATAAVREAKNREGFVSLVRERTGISLELVSALDEGKLTYRSVARVLDLHEGTAAVVDLGGGSLEVVFSDGGVITGNTSMPLGSVRLTETFGGAEACSGPRFREMRRHVDRQLGKRVRALQTPPTLLVGCGGNFTTLLTLVAASTGAIIDRNSPKLASLGPVSRAQVRTILDELRAMTLEQRLRVPGLPSDRADIVVAGLTAIERLMKHLGSTRLHVHPGGFREGLLMRCVDDLLAEQRRHDTPAGADEEMRIVRDFAARCQYPKAHCEHVARLAVSIYDQFLAGSAMIQGLGSDRSERLLLEASCVLHDIGTLVEYARHHKHGALMVRHADLAGLSPREIEIVACLVRYHRKREPSARHAEFAALSEPDQALVRRLCGIMRVADGLDRSHAQNVVGVHLRFRSDGTAIEVRSESDAAADIDAAIAKSGVLERVMGARVFIEAAGTARVERARAMADSPSAGGAA
jgi:exopolyphosphatase/guanosine-5'-triphosphate,3'-diphosphate pyrophosphatase